MVVRTIVVSVTDNKVKNVCKFLDLIEGVVEYNVAAEELGAIDKQPTNSTKVETLRRSCKNRSWNCLDYIKNCGGCADYDAA